MQNQMKALCRLPLEIVELYLSDIQDKVVARLKEVMDDFKEIMPLIEELANLALKARHWQEIFTLINADIPLSDNGTGEYLSAARPY